MKIPQPRTVSEIVKQFYDVISRPVRYASLFYTLYYLTEVENIRELRSDFEKIRDELYIAFHNYGIYSVGREMRFLAHGFAIKGDIQDERYLTAEEWQEVGKSREWINSRFSAMLEEAKFSRREASFAMLLFEENCNIMLNPEIESKISFDKDYKSVEGYCQFLENTFSAYSRDISFLSMSEKLFSINSYNRWIMNAGGQPWAKICKALLRRRTTKPTIFVDACWNIQHNTGVWLKKVEESEEEKVLFDKRAIVLGDIFEWNYDGNILPIFGVAGEYDQSLYKYKDYIK